MYALLRPNHSPIALGGNDLVKVIENNIVEIAEAAHVGNCAGFRLERIVARGGGIGGGRRGVVVEIKATGMPLAHTGECGPSKTGYAYLMGPEIQGAIEWIKADDGKLYPRQVNG